MPEALFIHSTQTISLSTQLHQFSKEKREKSQLIITKMLSLAELAELGLFINETEFSFTRIRLEVNQDLLEKEPFLNVLQQLNHVCPRGVALVFPVEEIRHLGDELVKLLIARIVPHVFYPLYIQQRDGHEVGPSALDLQELENRVISNIQQKQKSSGIVQSRKIDARVPRDSKKLKLKELIKKKQLQEERREYISLEVQHVETLEQEIVQQHQEVIELQVNAELQEIQEYEGSLIDYEAFTAPDSKKAIVDELHDEPLVESLCDLLRQELFANLPHAIKYFSPDAAKHMAANLALFVSLNKENLPHGFILKQTKEGELVLDYDCFIENDQAGAFTPELCAIDRESIYNISWHDNQTPPQWLEQAESQTLLTYFGFSELAQEGSLSQMTNIWIKHGDEGSAWFLTQLRRSTSARPELLAFLLTHYLKFIPQWEHVYKETFFTLLERVTRYDEEKLTCFKKFLENTGSSCHDLSRTVAGFEVFWSELSLLCAEHKVAISAINSTWSTPMGGNPVVYMERLLFILKNARSFKEQIELLNAIKLENYGAYYAVKYEAFKVVSHEMQLHYHKENCDLQSFNKDFKLHRVEIVPISEAFAEAYRHKYFIDYVHGQYGGTRWLVDCSHEQLESLDLESLAKELVIPYDYNHFVPPYQLYSEYPKGQLNRKYNRRPQVKAEQCYAAILKFIAVHAQSLPLSFFLERHLLRTNVYACAKLFLIALLTFREGTFTEEQIAQMQTAAPKEGYCHTYMNTIELFIALEQRGIFLTLREGLMLAGAHEKIACLDPQTLFDWLDKNKLAVFKLLNVCYGRPVESCLFKHTFDTAELLSQDTFISLAYGDNLLLFSRLLLGDVTQNYLGISGARNEDMGEVYDHARAERGVKLLQDLEPPLLNERLLKYTEKIKPYLQKAIMQQLPNNLYFLLHQIVWGTNLSFDLDKLLRLFEDIDKIPSFDKRRVKTELSSFYQKDSSSEDSLSVRLWIQNQLLVFYFKKMEPFLNKATFEKSPSNMRYAIRKMVGKRGEYLCIESFLRTCSEVEKISSFNRKKVNEIIRKHYLDLYLKRNYGASHIISSWINRKLFDLIVEEGLKKVRHYLHEAAAQETPNNLQYAIQIMLDAREFFCLEYFIGACDEIEKLASFNAKAVEGILRHYQFRLQAKAPKIFNTGNENLKTQMILLLLLLTSSSKKGCSADMASLKEDSSELNEKHVRFAELNLLPMAELRIRLQQAWEESGTYISFTARLFFNKILKSMKKEIIQSAFTGVMDEDFSKMMAEKIEHLSGFQECKDFDQLELISNDSENLAQLFKKLFRNVYVIKEKSEFTSLFSKVDFTQWNYDVLQSLLSFLSEMPLKNYLPLLKTLLTDTQFIKRKERVLEMMQILKQLNQNYFPSEYLHAFAKIVLSNQGQELQLDLNKLIQLFNKDAKDSFLLLLMANPELTYSQISQILQISEEIESNREDVSQWFAHLIQTKNLSFLNEFIDINGEAKKNILTILAKGYLLDGVKHQTINSLELVKLLKQLTTEELLLLSTFYETTPVSTNCLYNALRKSSRPENFEVFLLSFEKEPFGERALQQQFSLHEVERVINQSGDLLNSSAYPYQHRKQLMEAFLFLNAIGEHLPVYYNQPAKDLTNTDIKLFFADLKTKKVPGLTLFQSQLLALGLIREAMYRSTGEFPYSTQMIALIDGMLHLSDFISNIDTGQGKSLIDSMKAALLWLDSDRVDLTTSSIVDAQRDINNYGLFFQRLGIPYSKQPICSSTSMETFQPKGINFSTFAQLSLFFAKAKVSDLILDTPECRISLVANESDYLFLDDRVIYRFATADGAGIGYGQEWMYGVINQFVSHPEFIKNESTIDDDLESLKAYLKQKARELNHSAKIIDKFSNEYYVSLLESALIVNYALKENEDFVIPEGFEKKIIHGREVRSRVVKVLMGDDKVSPDSSFGNGIQQLLYARLNQERGSEEFIIEPQNRTIISTNNTSLIHYYRAYKGFIWGSSGTVGSSEELRQQHQQYGFEFSKAEPHQTNRVQFKKPIVKANEAQQFNYLVAQLTAGKPQDNLAPSVVFCRDINTATRFFKELSKRNPKQFPVQLYTGLGQEEDFIREARRPGMITVTTSALGRNTNICYDKKIGLRVWHTFIDSIRSGKQKSGRTGRQGSKGWVNFILNAEELHGKTIQQIQDDIERANALDRSTVEVLYNVLGYLLNHITTLPDEQFIHGKSAFLRKVWSEYSKEIEAVFKESRREAHYNPDVFMQFALSSLQKSVNGSITSPLGVDLASMKHALEPTQLEKKRYIPFSEEVKIQDCVPPIAIAYQLLPDTGEPIDLGDIKKELKDLFHELNTHNFAQKNGIYLRYLAAHPAKQEKIAAAHQEFLKDYLGKQLDKTTFSQRWLGYESLLQKTAGNLSYLLMFHTFAQVSAQPVVTTELMKQAVNKLLDDYLETSWFINTSRKEWALTLKEKIMQANEPNDIISLLSQAQIDGAKNDIQENKKRVLKPLHFFGHSRYQSTLNKALNLATSLSGHTNMTQLASGLSAITGLSEAELCIDKAQEEWIDSRKIDRSNGSVLKETLRNMHFITGRQYRSSMIGRQALQEEVLDQTSAEEKLLK